MTEVYNIRNVEAYFGFVISTDNSDFLISDKGVISGNSRYFIKHPEQVNATVKYIGSIPDSVLSSLGELYKQKSLDKLVELKVGNMCVMGLQTQGEEEMSDVDMWMHTLEIKRFYKSEPLSV